MSHPPHPAQSSAAAAHPGPRRKAVVDIGTNSVKLLVADVQGRSVVPVFETGEQTRLGRGFYETHRLQAEAIDRTASVVARFANTAREHGAPPPRTIATSAARDALNAQELIEAIRASSGLAVEVISGEQEADWVFMGVTTDPALQQRHLLLLDVGGGSTEFIAGQGSRQDFRHSFLLGTVRLLERLHPADPPTESDIVECQDWLREFMAREIVPKLGSLLADRDGVPVQLVGAGGTTAILARMALGLREFDRSRIEGTRLSIDQVRTRRRHLWTLPLSQRRAIPGLPPERADVILTGVAIFEAVMECFRLPDLWVTTRGLRFAALMD